MTELDRDGVVIVGASVAGVSAISELRRHGYSGPITLIGEEAHQPYARPPLSKGLLKGTDDLTDLALPSLDDAIDMRLGVTATGLDLARRRVQLETDDEIPYGVLIVATGARARTILPPGGPAEFTLRTIDDCLELKCRLDEAESVLVLGGGFLGMEVASISCELGREVTVVDVQLPLCAQLGDFLSTLIVSAAKERGVSIEVASAGVQPVGSGAQLTQVELPTGEALVGDVVLSAVGCTPNVEWLRNSGLEIDGGVHVDESCESAPGVFAAGDVTRVVRSGRVAKRTPQWMTAFDQGKLAARSVLAVDEPNELATISYFWTSAFGVDLRIAGPLPVVGDPTILEGDSPQESALLLWPSEAGPATVVAVNRRVGVPKLRRLALSHTKESVLGPAPQRVAGE